MVRLLALHLGWLLRRDSKLRRFVDGQHGLMDAIGDTMQGQTGQQVCWVHCSSLGEYGVARPLIASLRSRGWQVVLTLFSPSGYEVLHGRSDAADHVFYLPLDTRSNARRFLDAVKPQRAVFIISEYWINYLHELACRYIATYFVSMYVPDDSYLLKWYARTIRKALSKARCLMVLDDESQSNLAACGITNTQVMGDPLFDNAVGIAHQEYSNAIIEQFCGGNSEVLVAGSVSDGHDEAIVADFANRHPYLKVIVVPHEISGRQIEDIQKRFEGRVVRYGDSNDKDTLQAAQVLIVDYVGDLARIYRYGRYAYVGGGFTPYLHSVLEPAAYGIPMTFGPRVERKAMVRQMIKEGFAEIVETAADLDKWYMAVSTGSRYAELHQRCMDYVNRNVNATERIVNTITA